MGYNYVGKKVIHQKEFGEGVIVSQNSKGYIKVLFGSQQGEKTFLAPACFKQFLQLCDIEAAQAAAKENSELEEANKIAEEKRKQIERTVIISGHTSQTPVHNAKEVVSVPRFSTLEDFVEKEEQALVSEIVFLKKTGGKRTKLVEGKLIEVKNNHFIYSFETESELNLPDAIQISLWPTGLGESIPATVINCEDFTITLSTNTNLGDNVPSIEFSAESWRLLQSLIDRLKELRNTRSPIVQQLVCDGYRKGLIGKPIARGQELACNMSLTQPITFVWGPPGTGKTETLAKIALAHLKKGYRVLMLSYSNVSVDGAIRRVYDKCSEKTPGQLIRYGYPKEKYLLDHDYLTSYNYTLHSHPELLEEQKRLIENRRHLSRSSQQYLDIGRRLVQIRDALKEEEKESVRNAAFVATTVSKAIIDGLLYKMKFDTVIFDEASMAYIPQIVFSAGLATRHFICMGDFSQLPPIVQNDSTSILNADIFLYCGITAAVNRGYGHEWLCMLDTQYRMHPEIATFSSKAMYSGLLKSGDNMEERRRDIARSNPFAEKVFQLADLSGMMSVCIKTTDQSRINVLSAFVDAGLAIVAAKDHEVGIITPYHAQSRLLHAISRDIMEQAPILKKITCATVHQFQGSEKDIIIYDAVDCYRMKYPGALLTSNTNNYANRMFNVALTRAKGKFVLVANKDYMITKNLSGQTMFRIMIDQLDTLHLTTQKADIFQSFANSVLRVITQDAEDSFITDLKNARSDVHIDILGGMTGSTQWFRRLAEEITNLKRRGIKVYIRADSIDQIPNEIKPLVIENPYITNPVSIIDKKVTWYGMPVSNNHFVSEGSIIPTQYRPILRFSGKHLAQSLYAFLEMNNTIDAPRVRTEIRSDEGYSTFARYVSGEMKCCECGAPLQLRKSKKGRFFLACTNYPKCDYTELVDPEAVNRYFYFKNRNGKRCPQDNTSLEARINSKGIYVCCNGLHKHFFKLDEI
ncbi:MAG: topoisomerase DNA-binding C4 zinc finger domain-containing protein [Clostridia bacterium]|nr:topoisomerase DNA-binding C4 zinc finger domain-containing protein [Clostridia bacterium]